MPHFPSILDVELSNRCNLDCVMCPRLPQKMHAGDMAPALLDRVLDEALAVPERTFRLHGIGEPLLSPLFAHAVERIKSDAGGHRIELVTNAHLLDRERARFILRQGVDNVTLSVAAFTAETYRAVRQSTRFDRVQRNAIRFIGERDRMHAPTHIEVQLVRVPPADREVDAFIDFWARWDVTVEIWHDLNRGRRATGQPPLAAMTPCHHLYDYTVVCWDGRVGICCIDAARLYVVGNANQHTLAHIYNDARITAIRALHATGDTSRMPICVDCSFRNQEHIAFSANVHRTGQRPPALPPVPALPIVT